MKCALDVNTFDLTSDISSVIIAPPSTSTSLPSIATYLITGFRQITNIEINIASGVGAEGPFAVFAIGALNLRVCSDPKYASNLLIPFAYHASRDNQQSARRSSEHIFHAGHSMSVAYPIYLVH